MNAIRFYLLACAFWPKPGELGPGWQAARLAFAVVGAAMVSVSPIEAQPFAQNPSSQPSPTTEPAAIRCKVEESYTAGGVSVRGVLVGLASASGHYSLDVRKSGDAGASTIRQAGGFSLEPGQNVYVGQVTLGLEKGARFDAVLNVEIDGTTHQCRASGPSGPDL